MDLCKYCIYLLICVFLENSMYMFVWVKYVFFFLEKKYGKFLSLCQLLDLLGFGNLKIIQLSNIFILFKWVNFKIWLGSIC